MKSDIKKLEEKLKLAKKMQKFVDKLQRILDGDTMDDENPTEFIKGMRMGFSNTIALLNIEIRNL